MTWNHRVIRHDHIFDFDTDEVWFGVHECYYENPEDDIPHSWTDEATTPVGETPAELLETIHRFAKALEKPILIIEGDKLKIWEPE